MAKSVLVMGGTYFIGKKIVDFLFDEKYKVTVLNRGNKKLDNPKIENLVCDRNDLENMTKVLSNIFFDIVIDVSGVTPLQMTILLSSLNTTMIKQFIFISSSGVYDLDNQPIPYKETDILKANSYWTTYSQNKIDAEAVLINYFDQTKTILSILRPPYVYGENNYAPRESFIFEHLLSNKPIIIPRKGEKLIQFIHTTDIANIILSILNGGLNKLNIFNVGNKEPISMKNWVIACGKAANIEPNIIEFDYKKHQKDSRLFFPFFDYDNVLDVTKVNKIYSIETDFLVGLQQAFRWYVANKEIIKFSDKVSLYEQEILLLLQ